MPTLALGDIDLYYEIEGSGPPLLLIPGMTSDSASWLPVVPPLARRFTLIRPDSRATGRTRPMDAETSPAQVARDCLALLDHLGIDRTHLLGHSMGGLVALTLAHTAPERAERLVLAASAPVASPRNHALFETLLALRDGRASPDLWLRAFFPWLFHPRFFDDPARVEATLFAALAYPHAQTAAAMRRQLDGLAGFDPAPLAVPPPAPALALLASDDLLLPASLTHGVLCRMEGVRIETLPGTGHALHWDAPEAFADRVVAFLADAG